MYGSYAREDYHKDSDIDLVAIVKESREMAQLKLKDIWDISSDLELEYGTIVSPTVIPYEEFEYWLGNTICVKDIDWNGNEGIGKPEPLTGNLAGFWSRCISDKDRLIYKIDDMNIYILACRYQEHLCISF